MTRVKPVQQFRFDNSARRFAGNLDDTRAMPAFLTHVQNVNTALGLGKLYDPDFSPPDMYPGDRQDLATLTAKDHHARMNVIVNGPLKMTDKESAQLQRLQALEVADAKAKAKFRTDVANAMQTYATHTQGPANEYVLEFIAGDGSLQNFRNFQGHFLNKFLPPNCRNDLWCMINRERLNGGSCHTARDVSILTDNLKHYQREAQALGYGPWPDSEQIFLVKSSIVNHTSTVRIHSKISDIVSQGNCTFAALCALVNEEARSTFTEIDGYHAGAPFVGYAGSPSAALTHGHPAYSPYQSPAVFASQTPSDGGFYATDVGHSMHSPLVGHMYSPSAGFAGAPQHSLPGQTNAMHQAHAHAQHYDHQALPQAYATRLVQGSPARGRSPSPGRSLVQGSPARGRSPSPGRSPQVCFEWSIQGTCQAAHECRLAQTHTEVLKAAHPEYTAMLRVFQNEQRARSRSREKDVGGGRHGERSPGREGWDAGDKRGRNPDREARGGTPRRR